MRRLGILVALVLLAVLAGATGTARAADRGPAADTCAGIDATLRGPCYGVDVLGRDVHALAGPGHADAVRAYELSITHRQLALQYALAGDVPLANAPFLGTHNSFNSVAEMGPTLSDQDSNQQLSLSDQLRIDMRSLELDLHSFPSLSSGTHQPAVVVCHAQGPVGCTVERTLGPLLDEIATWLRAHPGQVILLYLEDQLDGQPAHDAAAALLHDHLGSLLYAPPDPSGACRALPLGMTRDDVLAAGAQVVTVTTGCGSGAAWHAATFDWSGAHVETRPVGFQGYPGCGPDYGRATYDTKLVRYFEDSTFLTAGTSLAGVSSEDDGITPDTAYEMTRCGVDLFGFDQILPTDGRLPAVVWSWASNQPDAGHGRCVVARGSDGRWLARPCGQGRRPAACRDPRTGAWSVTAGRVREPDAAAACAAAGAVFAVPRTGYENELLKAAADGAGVWLGYVRRGTGYQALDRRE